MNVDRILLDISHEFKQGRRLVKFLSANPNACTVVVNQACSIGNISDVARKLNPTLVKHGLFISCKRPMLPILNKFDEPSQMYEWSIHELRKAANDSEF